MNKTVIENAAIGEKYIYAEHESGLKIYICPKEAYTSAYAMFGTRYGSIDTKFAVDGGRMEEVPAGIAHFLEHKLFESEDGDAFTRYAKTGASANAYTSFDRTCYLFSCSDRFEESFDILLDFVQSPYFTKETVDKEQGIIGQEIRMYDDSADSAVMENLFRIMYQNHPVRNNIAGTVESIEEITAETLKLCHDTFYDPSNLIVCVIGDVDAQKIIDQVRCQTPAGKPARVERCYGAPEPQEVRNRRIEKEMEISMPAFAIGFRCPDAGRGRDAMRMELIGELAGEILIGESSELYQKLYDENVIDADFSVDYERMKGMALLELCGDSEQPERILQEVLQEAACVIKTGVDRALLDRLKKSVAGRRLRGLDGFEGTCYRMCAYYFDGAEYLEYPDIYAGVTAEDVEQFIRENVKEEQAFLSVITPKREEE